MLTRLHSYAQYMSCVYPSAREMMLQWFRLHYIDVELYISNYRHQIACLTNCSRLDFSTALQLQTEYTSDLLWNYIVVVRLALSL